MYGICKKNIVKEIEIRFFRIEFSFSEFILFYFSCSVFFNVFVLLVYGKILNFFNMGG